LIIAMHARHAVPHLIGDCRYCRFPSIVFASCSHIALVMIAAEISAQGSAS